MIQMAERVKQLFAMHIESSVSVADSLADAIATAGQRLVDCLLNGGSIFIAGNGGSSPNCAHFTSAMIHHFERERPPLPVINLSADASMLSALANEHHYAQFFARQVQALGKENDVLLLLTTSGKSDSLLNALHGANERGMDTIVLSGGDGGLLANHLGPEDLELRVPADHALRIREHHLFILHCFCDVIEHSLFGQL
jgi:D-sedoheptulose 7-phosphate isomerase